MKYLFLILIFSGVAEAQTYGCFVEWATGDCSTKQMQCSFDYNENLNDFGYTVATACEQRNSIIQACANDYTSLYNDYNNLKSSGEQFANSYSNLLNDYSYSLNIISKLRKKCGKKCRKIR